MRKDYNWTAGSRRSSTDAVWPPRGLHLAVSLRVDPLACAALRGITVDVHYEMYEAVPALSKWITVSVDDDHHNHHDHHDNHDEGSISSTSSPPKPPRLLNNVVVEQLGVNPPFSPQAWDPSVAQSFLQPGKLGSPVYAGSGQLHLEIDMEYATWVEWDDTFTKSTRGSVQPTLTAAMKHLRKHPSSDDIDAGAKLLDKVHEMVADVSTNDTAETGVSVSGVVAAVLRFQGILLTDRTDLKACTDRIFSCAARILNQGGADEDEDGQGGKANSVSKAEN